MTVVQVKISPVRLRREFGRRQWSHPTPFGPAGWSMRSDPPGSSVIVTLSDADEHGVEWVHASIAHAGRMPTYEDLTTLYQAVWGAQGWAYQVFAPPQHHVNIHAHGLHLWGRADGQPCLPNFGAEGTI